MPGLDPDGWPGLLSFPVARSLLEAAALAGWSLAPDRTERLRRCAQFQIWAAKKGAGAWPWPGPGGLGSAERVREIVDAAGFEVHERRRNSDLVVFVNGKASPARSP
ncbi:hypothetical protein L3Q67_26095 [Saccharothrix sp. AJ9571]|nr:hypothetical protein L3Q67_26095 [Saccharothrix sp. AJ9571]